MAPQKILQGNFLTDMAEYKVIGKPNIPARAAESHKGTFGTALLFCGSVGFSGAAVLAAKGCLRSGVGIAKLAVPDKIYPICAANTPETVFLPLKSDRKGKFGRISKKLLQGEILKADSILIGCGIGVSKNNLKLIELLIENARCPLIIDADGINLLASNINILKRAKTPIILTPHPAEMSRLSNISVSEIQQNREETAKNFATEHKVYLVLKGHKTVVATPDGDVFVNKTGNAGMATGGSGDVLSGICAALLCKSGNVTQSVKSAVYIHGAAGDLAAEKLCQTSMLPSDIIEELPCMFKTLEG